MAQRLPVVGGDDDTWGSVLNGFLGISLYNNINNSSDPNNGTINSGVIADTQIVSSAAINPSKIAGTAEVQTNKGVASGYAALNSSGLIPTTQLAGGTGSSSNFLRGDGTWVVPPTGAALDSTLADIQPDTTTGTAVVGSTGKAADAGHQHSLASHDHSSSAKGGAIPEASITNLTGDLGNRLQLGGDVGGTVTAPIVSSSNGVPIVTTTGTQTLTNKSISGSQITSAVASATTAASVTTIPAITGDVTSTGSSNATTLTSSANVTSIISANSLVAGALQKTNNLNDVSDPGSSRSNIRVPILTPAACVSIANIAGTYTTSGAATFTPSSNTAIDGYTYAVNDLILLTAQSTATQNGLWQVPTSGSTWTRPTEFSTGTTVKGRTCTILNGTTYISTTWVLGAPTAGIVIDSANQTWAFANLSYNAAHYSPLGAVNRYAGSSTTVARIPFVNVDDFGADPTGAADSTAAYNAALLALPTVNSAPAGEIRFNMGTYKMGAVATSIIGAQVRVRGAGRYATFISYTGSGSCFRLQNPSDPRITNGSSGGWTSIIQWGGGFGGMTIDGTSASAGASGIQYGDNEGGLIEDIAIQHFNLTGSVGLLLNNNIWWTEKLRAKAQLLDNTVNCLLMVSITPGGVTNAPGVSYGYNDLDLEIFANPGQDGVFVSTGANFYNGWLKIRGNFSPATTAAGTYKLGTSTISAMLRVGGTNPNGSNGSTVTDARLDLQAEVANTGGSYAPFGIYFGAGGGTNSILNSSGILSLGVNQGFKICNYNIANNALIFTFSGIITGDTNLNAGSGLCVIGSNTLAQSQITVAGSTYTLKVAYGDVFDLTLTQASTISLTNGGVGPCKKILRTTQGAGGPWTITWPRTTAYASATVTNTRVNFAGGSTTNATQTAGAVDIWYLSTIDGANWFCSPFLAQG